MKLLTSEGVDQEAGALGTLLPAADLWPSSCRRDRAVRESGGLRMAADEDTLAQGLGVIADMMR